MTVEELLEKYNLESGEEAIKRIKKGQILHPTYKKHLEACWIIQDIWGHVELENLSLGKARELTASVIEKHLNGKL